MNEQNTREEALVAYIDAKYHGTATGHQVQNFEAGYNAGFRDGAASVDRVESELDGIRRRNQEKDLTYEGNMNEEDHLKTLREMLSQCKRASVAVGGQSNIEDAAREESSRFAKSIRFAISAIERSRWVAVSEGNPKSGEYFVTCVGGYTAEAYFTDRWYSSIDDMEMTAERFNEVAAWMPKPEPYTPKEQI